MDFKDEITDIKERIENKFKHDKLKEFYFQSYQDICLSNNLYTENFINELNYLLEKINKTFIKINNKHIEYKIEHKENKTEHRIKHKEEHIENKVEINYNLFYDKGLKHREWVNVHDNKLKFSCNIFDDFFIRKYKYVHISADTQMGKTSVINCVSQLVKRNSKKFKIQNYAIFIFTGLSDTAWVDQTRSRIHPDLKAQVYHNKTLHKMVKEL